VGQSRLSGWESGASPIRFLTVGDLEIASLPDAHGSFGTYEELFPSTVDSVWDPWRMKLPELFKGEAWMVPFGAFMARGPRARVLIDTGLGPPPGEQNFMYVRQGWLPQSLEAAGVAPDDVDIVFSTHHHSDHIGWNVKEGRPLFPHARYVNGAAAWDWTLSNRTEDWILAQLTPLVDTGVVDLVEDGAEIAPGMTAIATPGHYPGHMSVLIDSISEPSFWQTSRFTRRRSRTPRSHTPSMSIRTKLRRRGDRSSHASAAPSALFYAATIPAAASADLFAMAGRCTGSRMRHRVRSHGGRRSSMAATRSDRKRRTESGISRSSTR
jgi:hypothetical protein